MLKLKYSDIEMSHGIKFPNIYLVPNFNAGKIHKAKPAVKVFTRK